jgi:hypothetical protein
MDSFGGPIREEQRNGTQEVGGTAGRRPYLSDYSIRKAVTPPLVFTAETG